METILSLLSRGFLTENQASRAIEFITAPEKFFLRPWEEELLCAILVDQIGIMEAENRFGLPTGSAKAIVRLILQGHDQEVRSCSGRREDVVGEYAEDGILLLHRLSSNEELCLIEKFDFTPMEAKLFEALRGARAKPTSEQYIFSELYRGKTDTETASLPIVKVMLCHVRRKIKGSQFSIETVRGRGFILKSSLKLSLPKPDVSEHYLPEDINRLCGRDPLELLKLATEFGLGPMEARFVSVLRNAMSKPTPKEYVLTAMFFHDPDKEFSEESLNVLVYKTNLKLERFGGGIKRISGGGFVLN